jgi:urease accessory protein
MKKVIQKMIAAIACVCFATPALAHTGHADTLGFTAGFMHPLFGIDHMLAMVGVGLFAAQLGGRAFWMVPAAFLAAMIAGGAAGHEGLALPLVEQAIALSVITMGAVLAMGVKMPTGLAAALVAAFALFHGHAHGSEGATVTSFAHYTFGFASATCLLLATGMALSHGLASRLRTAARTA